MSDNVVQNVPQDVSRMSLEEIENIIRVNGSATQETTKETTQEKNSIQEQIVLRSIRCGDIRKDKFSFVRDKKYEERNFRQDRGIRWKYILG